MTDIERRLNKMAGRTSAIEDRLSALQNYGQKSEQKTTGLVLPTADISREAEREQLENDLADINKQQRLLAARTNLARRSRGFTTEDRKAAEEDAAPLRAQADDLRHGLAGMDYEDRYQTIDRQDNFGGQFLASWDAGRLGQDEARAWYDYLSNPTEGNRAYAEAVSSARENYLLRNQNALDEDATLPLISQSFAGYLPQFIDQNIAGAKGALAGAAAGSVLPIAGTAAGAKAGFVAGRTLYGYETARGAAFKALLDAGVDEETARSASGDEALLSAILEGGDAVVDMLTLGIGKGIAALVGQPAKAAATSAGRKALSVLGKYGINVASEGAQEWVQEGVSSANAAREGTGALNLIGETAGQIGRAVSGQDPEALARMNQAGIEGMKVAAIMGGASLGGNALLNRVVSRSSSGGNIQQENVQTDNRLVLPGNEQNNTAPERLHEVLTASESGTPLFQSESTSQGADVPLRNDMPLGEPEGSPTDNSILPGGQDVNHKRRGIEIPVESRTWEDASNRRVNAFQYDHPELHPYYAEAARALQYELSYGTRGERFPVRDTEGYTIGMLGTRRNQASPIVHALDDGKLSYQDIDNALNAIINDRGQENYAAAKKMELVLDEMLSEGYTDTEGRFVEPDAAYLRARDAVNRGFSSDSTEYRMSEEEWASLLENEPTNGLELPGGQDVNIQSGTPQMGSESLPETAVGAEKISPWVQFQASSDEFIPEGANAAREVEVPVRDPQGRRIRRTASTAMGAKAIPDEIVGDIQNMVLRGELSYDRVSDKASINRAIKTIQDKGYQGTLEEFRNAVNKGVISKDIATLGQQLLINAANAGDSRTTAELLSLYAQMETTAGQAVQAASILRKLDPSSQLYAAQRVVNDLEKAIQDKYKDIEITIDQSLIDEFNSQTTQEGRDAVMDRIYQNVADQVPSTWRDKWNAWRYLAMLANPRTHVRNFVGNIGFQPLRFAKDRVASVIEAGVSRAGGNIERTKSFALSPELYRAAWNDWTNVKDVLSGNKYDDVRSEINSRRRIFKTAPLEAARTGNSWLLEFEDSIFKRITYADALAGYLQANGVTAEQVQNNTVDANLMARARDYAGQEALKATYQDRNQFSNLMSRRARETGSVSKAANVALDAVLPFRRTPANILVRGFEYSPLGLAKSLTADLYKVKQGKLSAAEAIDNIAAGLTGTGLFALGAYLFSEGIVTSGGGDDENQDALNELTGGQNYALNLPGGGNVTLDWLAPEALPFFMGVELMDSLGQDGSTAESIMDALSSISEPMLNLSMLQSLNDMIDSVSYADSSQKITGLVGSALISYFTQAVPTIGGQFERSGEENRMSTYTDKNLQLPTDIQYAIGRASARIPGWDYQQIPYIDAWGRREDSGPLWLRTANNFLNPAYTSNSEVTPVDEEIQRLYDETGESGIVPDRPQRYITVNGERIDLSAEQYTQYAEERGQMQFSMLEGLVDSSAYQRLSDTDKAAVVSDVYSYADAVTKSHISDYEPEGWIAKVVESGADPAEYILYKHSLTDGMTLKERSAALERSGITGREKTDLLLAENPEWTEKAREYGVSDRVYVEFKVATSDVSADKDEDGKSVSGSKKKKVMDIIDGMDVSDEVKDSLYYAAGYTESTIDDAPWR